jgi:hypothetical protein
MSFYTCFDWFKKLRLFVNVRNRKINVVLKESRAVIIRWFSLNEAPLGLFKFITYLVQIRHFCMTNMTGSKLSIFSHPGKITGYWIITRSFPYRGQYGCLFSSCRKYVINSLIYGHFHIGLVIIPRPILVLDSVSGQYGDLGMITRPIWKCPCINLYLFPIICFILKKINIFFNIITKKVWINL